MFTREILNVQFVHTIIGVYGLVFVCVCVGVRRVCIIARHNIHFDSPDILTTSKAMAMILMSIWLDCCSFKIKS